MPPVPRGAKIPAVLICTPLAVPCAVAVKGLRVEDAPVFRLKRLPVEVELPSVKVHGEAVPVNTPLVKVVVFVPIPKDSDVEGFVSEDHAVEAEPAQEDHVGVPPFVSVKHTVPAPPTAEAWMFPVPFP